MQGFGIEMDSKKVGFKIQDGDCSREARGTLMVVKNNVSEKVATIYFLVKVNLALTLRV